jgi:hypothetical protein
MATIMTNEKKDTTTCKRDRENEQKEIIDQVRKAPIYMNNLEWKLVVNKILVLLQCSKEIVSTMERIHAFYVRIGTT